MSLHSATPGNDYCNGYIAPIQQPNTLFCSIVHSYFFDGLSIIICSGKGA